MEKFIKNALVDNIYVPSIIGHLHFIVVYGDFSVYSLQVRNNVWFVHVKLWQLHMYIIRFLCYDSVEGELILLHLVGWYSCYY